MGIIYMKINAKKKSLIKIAKFIPTKLAKTVMMDIFMNQILWNKNWFKMHTKEIISIYLNLYKKILYQIISSVNW